MTAALEERARIRKTCLDLASVEGQRAKRATQKGHVDDAVIARCKSDAYRHLARTLGPCPPRSASVAGGVVHVYIAAPLTLLRDAKRAAALLAEDQECEVVSSWHAGAPTVEAERALSPDEATELAERCLREVERCDVLLLLYGPPTDRHGSIWEAAWAARAGRAVCAVAARERAKLPTILLRAAPRLHRPALTLGELGAAIGWHVREAARLPRANFGGRR